MCRVIGIKGRSRVLAVLRAFRRGRFDEIETRGDAVEFLLLFRGRWKAVERNRLRRRCREGLRALLRAADDAPPARPVVIKAERRMLRQDWNLFLETIRENVAN